MDDIEFRDLPQPEMTATEASGEDATDEQRASPTAHGRAISAVEDLVAEAVDNAREIERTLDEILLQPVDQTTPCNEPIVPVATPPGAPDHRGGTSEHFDEVIDGAMVIAEAETRAEAIRKQAQDAADKRARKAETDAELAVERARDEYKAKADKIVNMAIADSELLIRDAEHQAQEVLGAAIAQAQQIRQTAQHEAEDLATRSHAQRDKMLAEVEELKLTAQGRLSVAFAEAAERGAASAREKVDAQLIDTRREMQQLENTRSAALKEANEEATRLREAATNEAALMMSSTQSQMYELVASSKETAAALVAAAETRANAIVAATEVDLDRLPQGND